MALISIIMTVYNREKYLATAIDSILAQDFQDFELIIWDDGSTDRSLCIALEYAQKDSRVKVEGGFHLGRIPSLINAKKIAQGKFLGVVDSDDWISSNTLSASLTAMETKNVGLTYTNCLLVTADGKPIIYRPQSIIPYSRDRLLIDFVCFHFRLYSRELFEQIGGYDLDILYCEDYDLTLKLSEITQVKFVPEATYFYRQHAKTQGAKLQVERVYWTKKIIENSLERTKDSRSLEVLMPPVRFRLNSK